MYHHGNTSLAALLWFYAEPALEWNFHNNPEIICTTSRLDLDSVEHMLAAATWYPTSVLQKGEERFSSLLCICHPQTPVPQWTKSAPLTKSPKCHFLFSNYCEAQVKLLKVTRENRDFYITDQLHLSNVIMYRPIKYKTVSSIYLYIVLLWRIPVNSQNPHQVAYNQTPITPASEALMPSSGLHRYLHSHAHTHTQTTHMHNFKIINLKICRWRRTFRVDKGNLLTQEINEIWSPCTEINWVSISWVTKYMNNIIPFPRIVAMFLRKLGSQASKSSEHDLMNVSHGRWQDLSGGGRHQGGAF